MTFLEKEFKPGDVGGVVIGNTMAGNQITADREALLTAVRAAKPNMAKSVEASELVPVAPVGERRRGGSNCVVERPRGAGPGGAACMPGRSRYLQEDGSRTDCDVEGSRTVGELRPAARRNRAHPAGTCIRTRPTAGSQEHHPDDRGILRRRVVGRSATDCRGRGSLEREDHSLDARGLDTRQINDMHQMTVMDPGGGMPLDAYNTTEDGPNMLAVDTGGYVIRNTNKFGGCTDADCPRRRHVLRHQLHALELGAGWVVPQNLRTHEAQGRLGSREARLSGNAVGDARQQCSNSISCTGARIGHGQSSCESTRGTPTVGFRWPSISSRHRQSAGSEETVPAAAAPVAVTGTSVATASPARSTAAAFALRPDSSGRIDQLARSQGSEAVRQGIASQGWDRYQKGDLEGASALLGKAVAGSRGATVGAICLRILGARVETS